MVRVSEVRTREESEATAIALVRNCLPAQKAEVDLKSQRVLLEKELRD